MIAVDTNVLLRRLLNDDATQAERNEGALCRGLRPGAEFHRANCHEESWEEFTTEPEVLHTAAKQRSNIRQRPRANEPGVHRLRQRAGDPWRFTQPGKPAQNADIERSNPTSREELLSESAKNRLPTLCTKFELVINLKAAKDLGRVDLPVGDSGDGGF